MRYENFEVEAYKLQIGVSKLMKYGMDIFELYADEVGMSYCDRNRVIGKCKISHGKTELKEMPCPKQLVGERWEFYTKVMGYSNEKTRETIKRVDASFLNEFSGKYDVTSLARGIG